MQHENGGCSAGLARPAQQQQQQVTWSPTWHTSQVQTQTHVTAASPECVGDEVFDIVSLDGTDGRAVEPNAEEGAYVSIVLLQVLQGALQGCNGVMNQWPVLDGLVAQQQVAVPV